MFGFCVFGKVETVPLWTPIVKVKYGGVWYKGKSKFTEKGVGDMDSNI